MPYEKVELEVMRTQFVRLWCNSLSITYQIMIQQKGNKNMKKLYLLTEFNIVCFFDGEEFRFLDISEWLELNSKTNRRNWLKNYSKERKQKYEKISPIK